MAELIIEVTEWGSVVTMELGKEWTVPGRSWILTSGP